MTHVIPIKYETAKINDHSHDAIERAFLAHINTQTLIDGDPECFSLEYAKMLKPDDIVAFKRPEVQDSLFRNLRLGKLEVHARLDLHAFTLEEARGKILTFLKQSQRMDIRTVLIVHGKGERSTPVASMKSFLCQWLEQIKDVQCFHSAQRHQGGASAVYVHLKKSQEKKLLNREFIFKNKGE